jgi:A/G-specific adenine glycosylase
MLQQTRVETVIPYYERFLARFPDLQTLADAEEESVYALWAGLGYYSRARNLHAAARKLVTEFRGSLPSDPKALQSLPGVGRYTAGAVASIAFDRPEAVVDGNVTRVLCRLLGIRDDVGLPTTAARLWQEAAALVRGARPGALNQALMELGALVCIPKAPECPRCPLRRSCAALRSGDAARLPNKAHKPRARRVAAVALWLARSGRTLVVKRESGGLLGGLWELPGEELASRERPAHALARLLGDRLGLAAQNLRDAGSVQHTFTHRELTLHVFRADVASGRLRRDAFAHHRWLAASRLGELPTATLTRKALRLANALDRQPRSAPSAAAARARPHP